MVLSLFRALLRRARNDRLSELGGCRSAIVQCEHGDRDGFNLVGNWAHVLWLGISWLGIGVRQEGFHLLFEERWKGHR